ncbi:MAG: suppressor of fused domain protein [Oscillospiraceae bacterium]|nr:suppressor of fused domain protein [Oscillospiraceae bacterium]
MNDKEKLDDLFGKLAEGIKDGKISPEDFRTLFMPADSLNTEHIEDFLDTNFPDDNGRVLHEMLSEKIHLDVFYRNPAENRPYYVLMTSGMSDLPMTFDEDCGDEFIKDHSRAELMMFLPPDWDMDSKDECWFWPIRALKASARFPHLCDTWIGHGHDIQFTEPCEPFADNTKLCSMLFTRPHDEKLRFIEGEDGEKINIYVAVPIYEEEMNFKIPLENGGDALLEKLFGTGEIPVERYVVDINRKNVCL